MNKETELFRFALVVPLGFEELATSELRFWLKHLGPEHPPHQDITTEEGICELDLPWSVGLSLNYLLKIPTRILMRVKTFRAKDFPRLYQRLKNIDWSRYAGNNLTWKISTHASRLSIKKRILSTCEDASKSFLSKDPENENNQLAFLRIFDNTCTVSIDTSGLPLYKRGIRRWTCEAPIRENLASGLLLFLKTHLKSEEDLGLLDPFVGSGVFLLENAIMKTPLNQRAFSFENWPEFQEKNISLWEHVSELGESSSYSPYFGSDINPKAIQACQKNLDFLKKSFGHSEHGKIVKSDIFKLGVHLPETPYAVICNPPYNQRIKVTDSNSFFTRIIDEITQWSSCRILGIIIPNKHLKSLKLPAHVERLNSLKFRNGGLAVTFLLLHHRRSNR